ncbi:hypothetical protein ACHAXM_006692 [Skeletonema potamos]
MAAATAPPILTNITSNQLECTLHCTDYHCLLRLRSDSAKSNDASSSTLASSPDISSLGVIPIDVDIAAAAVHQDSIIIHLLPSLQRYKSEQTATSEDFVKGCQHQHHPCHELIRISHNLQVQLKERLQDASNRAITSDKTNTNNTNGVMEDFLIRSEAVFQELLSAVKQQSRREETSRCHSNSNGRQNNSAKKRARITSSTAAPSLSATTPPPLEYYHTLLRQLHTLQNMPNVKDITLHKDINRSNNSTDTNDAATTADLRRVSITCQDSKQRSHTWHAELYPTIVLTVDLPAEFVLEDTMQGVNTDKKWWVNTNNTMDHHDDYNYVDASSSLQQQQLLPRIQQHFLQTINNYQSLFDELDDLDSNLWILEPTLPARRSCVERRIALWEGGASVVIMLDHEKPRGVPIMVRFLGVTMATITALGGASTGGSVADWRASFAEFVSEEKDEIASENQKHVTGVSIASSNKKRWSEERSIRENLEFWLGSSLPSPVSTEKSDYLLECGICYSHRLPVANEEEENSTMGEEGPLPEEKCCNSNCNRYYHESCLFEWLHSLPTVRVSFDRIFGNCPYCCEGVSVKVLNRAQH